MDFPTLQIWAEEELASLQSTLPNEIRHAANQCVVSLERRPSKSLYDKDLDGDELGLFEGPSLLDDPSSEEIPRIRLFLENLWDWVDREEQDYREEVVTTYLHELGHYLGWDEEEIAERGLD